MPKKKQQNYGEMKAQMEKMVAAMKQERERMAGVMATALLDDSAAVKLGGYSDKDLQNIMRMLAGHIDECVAVLEAEKQARREQAAPVETPQ